MAKKNAYSVIALSHHQEPKTGAHKRFDRLVEFMGKSNCDLVWVTPPRSGEKGLVESQIQLPLKQRKTTSARIWLLGAIIQKRKQLRAKRGRIKVLCTFGETTLPAALVLSLIVGAPLCIGVRSNILKRAQIRRQTQSPHKRLVSWLHLGVHYIFLFFAYRFASQVSVQTQQAKETFLKQYKLKPEKVVVIENDIPRLPIYRSRVKATKKVPERILFVGNDSRVKGYDCLCAAMSKLNPEKSSVKELTLIGVASVPRALKTNNALSVEVLPWTNNIVTEMGRHDLLVVPSREDQFPNVVLEALAVGLPVIGSDVDGIRYMLQDEFVLFPPGDPYAILEAIKRVSSSLGYKYAMEIAEERKSYFDFPWEDRYLSLLRSVVE